MNVVQDSIVCLCSADPKDVSLIPWTPTTTCKCTGTWDHSYQFPTRDLLDGAFVCDILRHFTTVAARCEQPTAAMQDWLDRYAYHDAVAQSGGVPHVPVGLSWYGTRAPVPGQSASAWRPPIVENVPGG